MQFAGKKLRHEHKYYISMNEYEGLRRRIRPLLAMDRNSIGEEGYHIRSLYFDDAHERSLFDKNNGYFHRKKYRIRIYNISDKIIKLERKSKYNEYVAKESASLSRTQVDNLLKGEYDSLREIGSPVAEDFYWDLRAGKMRPSVIVDYWREAYIEPFSDTRITFDKELSAGLHEFDLFDDKVSTWYALNEPKMILEVKYNHYLPGSVAGLLQMSAHQRSTISKYVLCKERQKVFLS
ncbi:molecular chaperone [Cohnella xylanilytica]|uniref:Polyphosphate polymerase domain-containing protein n=1 Tax=Cohnella xylanilytica TaxID=557555 RepID=A0A841TWX8_9BACL|nr:polyphosphate polymerase domain-containing protein [Cohnella xylanilytica]MBB6691532.1 polyphosphate polymerase domain-containing protein [Cohnella xylanilytica]GIO12903.1 molecular chaperone [Cohnella xylanilytica]